ncbi:MAG: ASKHA domain-containing protein [Lachnospiraceae bacterium]
MPEITAGKKTFSYDPGEKKNLMQLLMEQKLFVDNSCNGKGVCGKCKVQLTGGEIPPVSETERSLLKEEEIEKGIRLSCLVIPETDLQIILPDRKKKHKILTDGYMPELEFHPAVSKKKVIVRKTDLEEQTSFEEQMLIQTGADEIHYDVLLETAFEPGEYTAVITETETGGLVGSKADGKTGRKTVVLLEPGDTEQQLYGAAIDIGTTTVVVSLIDLRTGEEKANASQINAQKHLGLDVLTRITCEMERPREARKELQEAIVTSINEMLQEICQETGIGTESIYEITVAANCTMMHMLLGIDARPIGKSPYAPVFAGARTIPAERIGIHAAKNAQLYCLPGVSAYIGADIVAGAYVCGLHQVREKVLFIDIGTNGEIVLSNGGKMLCCSCAAGPALEGMNISCGMRAAEGAIEDVVISEEGVKLTIIGEEENAEKLNPEGICGSGILAVVKELVRTGLIRKDGAFIKPEKLEADDYRKRYLQMNGKKREFLMVESPEKLVITQGDVRQVQLAKGAILSGFVALLKEAGVSMEELDKVMIAGQFGAHLPADSLTGTGILPRSVENKLVYVGNSSKTGAAAALLSLASRREMEQIAKQMSYMELGNTPGYERLFAESMMFAE